MHLKPPFLCCFRGLLGHTVGVGGCDGGGGLAPTIWKLTLRLCQLWRQLSRWHARDCCRSDRPCFISFHLPVLPVLSEISGKPRSVNNESPLPKQKLELNRFGDGIRLFNTLEQPFSIRKPHKAWGSSATPVCCFPWRDHENHPHLIGCSASVFITRWFNILAQKRRWWLEAEGSSYFLRACFRGKVVERLWDDSAEQLRAKRMMIMMMAVWTAAVVQEQPWDYWARVIDGGAGTQDFLCICLFIVTFSVGAGSVIWRFVSPRFVALPDCFCSHHVRLHPCLSEIAS